MVELVLLFSCSKIKKLDENHKSFNRLHACFTLLCSEFSEKKILINHRGFVYNPGRSFQNSIFIEFRMNMKPKNEAIAAKKLLHAVD